MADLITSILKGIVSVFIYVWWIPVLAFAYYTWQNTRKSKWVAEQESTVLEIKVPKNNDKDPTAAEMMFATLHGILKPRNEHIKEGTVQDHISFEIVANEKSISFYVWVPKNLKDFVEGQIYAQYPSADIVECHDYADKLQKSEFITDRTFAAAELVLEKDDFLPIKTFNNFTVDPLAGITGVLSKLDGKKEEIWIQILSRPVGEEWKEKGQNWVKAKKSGVATSKGIDFSTILRQPMELIKDFAHIAVVGPLEAKESGKDGPNLSTEEDSKISGVEEKSQKLAYETKIRVLYSSCDDYKSKERIQAVIGAFKQFNTTNLNGFKGKIVGGIGGFLDDYRNRIFLDNGFHLNIEELASVYHLPHLSVETPNITWTTFKTAEAPTTLPSLENTEPKDLALFAETNFRGKTTEFGLKRDDRRRHMYIIGKSGMGKTKLLENLVINDIKNGEGVAIIDPHGDFCTDILNKIPKERMKDVVLFDPSDADFPIAFNPMEVIDESLKIQTALGIVGTFKKIFGFSWGPRLEYVLTYTILALLDTPGSTLLGVVRMLTEKNFRKTIVDNIQDPVVKKFWVSEFATYNDKQASETIAPILNKVGQFISNSLIRNVIGQPKSSFNIRELMDDRKIFLVNLSVGRLGESNASLLGSFMITAIHLAAMSRANIDEDKRKDFYLYVDEFQNFATDSFKNILSEARKYRLALIVANQYTAQLEDSGVKDAVFGNVGSIVTFRVGADDANDLVKEFSPPFEALDLVNLPKQHIYIRMTIDGQSEAAFSAKTLTVLDEKSGLREEIMENSRRKYTRPKKDVEKDVADWSGINITYANVEKEIEAGERASASAPRINAEATPAKKTDLADIIKANTGHMVASNNKQITNNKNIENHTKEEAKENKVNPKDKPKTETKIPEELPQVSGTVKDRIDKETLSAILEKIVKPSAPSDADNKVNTTQQTKSPEQESPKIIKKENNAYHKDEKKNNQKVGESTKPKSESPSNNKNNNSNKTTATGEQIGKFPSNKNEKVITPKNFKDIKQIHPHETVRIVTTEPKEIKEGQRISFK